MPSLRMQSTTSVSVVVTAMFFIAAPAPTAHTEHPSLGAVLTIQRDEACSISSAGLSRRFGRSCESSLRPAREERRSGTPSPWCRDLQTVALLRLRGSGQRYVPDVSQFRTAGYKDHLPGSSISGAVATQSLHAIESCMRQMADEEQRREEDSDDESFGVAKRPFDVEDGWTDDLELGPLGGPNGTTAGLMNGLNGRRRSRVAKAYKSR